MKYISLGAVCSVARQLESLGKRECALPFDWIRILDFNTVLDLITNNFKDYLLEDNFLFVRNSDKFPLGIDENDMTPTTSAVYRHKKYDISYFHDFKITPLKEQFTAFKDKQQRRIDRLYELITSNNEIVFIRDDIKRKITQKQIDDFFTLMNKINPKNSFKLLIISHNPKKLPVPILTKNPAIIFYDDQHEMGEWWRPNVPWAHLLLSMSMSMSMLMQ